MCRLSLPLIGLCKDKPRRLAGWGAALRVAPCKS
jgi:hypothetical protein